MANECLVTKLKGVVQNDNLPIFGKIRINSTATVEDDSARLRIWVDGPTTIESVSGEPTIHADQYVSTYTVNSGELSVTLGAGDYLLTNYHITKIHGVTYWAAGVTAGKKIRFNIDDLKYNNLTEFCAEGDRLYGSLKSFAGKTLEHLAFFTPSYGVNSVPNCEVTGTTEDVANVTFDNPNGAMLALPNLITGDIANIVGSFSNFAIGSNGLFGDILSIINQSPKLYLIKVQNNPRITGDISNVTCPLNHLGIGGSGVYIELTTFAAAQVAAGRTTGSLGNGSWWGQGARFNGEGFGLGADTIKWRPSEAGITGGVTDLMSTLKNVAIVIDAEGNKVGDTTPWS